MKKHTPLLASVLLSAVTLLSLGSCEKKATYHFRGGDEVRFTIGSNSAETKAAYSGQTNAAGDIERIDWQEGDTIRIYCEAVSEPSEKYTDYVVTEVEESTDEISTATIQGTGKVGLRWNETPEVEHTFYAVYPSPDASGVAESIEKNVVTANLPAVQGGKLKGNVVEPDMKNMLMTAKSKLYTTSVDIPEGEDVFLSFTPLTTAIEFTVTNGTAADMSLKSVELSSASKALNGAFTVDMDVTGIAAGSTTKPADESLTVTYKHSYPAASADATADASADARRVSIDLASASGDASAVEVAPNGTLTFTFFVIPTSDLEDLTFKFVKSDDSSLSMRLGYTDGSGLFFPKHAKSKVKGLVLPDKVQWTIEYTGSVITTWDTSGESSPTPIEVK